MTPRTKKIVYGLVYIFIVFIVVYLIWFLPSKPQPTCFDNILNQDEEGVDCGGPCEISCYAKYAKPLEVLDSFLFFKDLEQGKLFTLFTIRNKNNETGSHLFYFTLKFFDDKNNFVGSVDEKTSILPGESKMILSQYESSVYNIERIKKAKVEFGNFNWAKGVEFLKPNIILKENPVLYEENGNLVVEGTISNQSLFRLPKVRILALILNKYDDVLFALQTITGSVESYEDYNFKIFLPLRLIKENNLKNLKADIFAYVEE
jgi:hypothetical protein